MMFFTINICDHYKNAIINFDTYLLNSEEDLLKWHQIGKHHVERSQYTKKAARYSLIATLTTSKGKGS